MMSRLSTCVKAQTAKSRRRLLMPHTALGLAQSPQERMTSKAGRTGRSAKLHTATTRPGHHGKTDTVDGDVGHAVGKILVLKAGRTGSFAKLHTATRRPGHHGRTGTVDGDVGGAVRKILVLPRALSIAPLLVLLRD